MRHLVEFGEIIDAGRAAVVVAGASPLESKAEKQVARELGVSPEGHRQGCPGGRWGKLAS